MKQAHGDCSTSGARGSYPATCGNAADNGKKSVAMAALLLTLRPGQLRRSLIVMAIVGTLLNFINQPDVFSGAAQADWARMMLTYSVPFCVATYGAWSAHLSQIKNNSS